MQTPLGDYEEYYKTVTLHLGAVGQGYCNAQHVRCSDGYEYLIKGPALVNNFPFVGVNELVSGRIGRALRLPLNDFEIVRWRGDYYFATRWIEKGFSPYMTASLLDQCRNKDSIYDLVAFDSLIFNGDRHAGNLIAINSESSNRLPSRRLMFTDHSHALFSTDRRRHHFQLLANSRVNEFLPPSFVARAISDPELLYNAVARIEALADTTLEACCRALPREWISDDDTQALAELLVLRRDRLRTAFVNDRHSFPRMNGPRP